MYFQDLTPFKYSTDERCGNAQNVGWLSIEHEFPRGDTPEEFRRVLRLLSAESVNQCMGWHDCEFCETPPQKLSFWRRAPTRSNSAAKGNGEIHVPTAHGDIVYVAPQLVAHYVEEHRYRPPNEFVEAVLAYKPPVIPWEAIRSDWQDQLPVLDGEWHQWRIFSGGSLLAVIPGDRPSAALDLLQRQLELDMKGGVSRDFDFNFEVSRSLRGSSGEGVVIEQIRHVISCDFTKTPAFKNTRHWLLSSGDGR